ncbi:MAG TPA: HAD-IIA family hydrolase [Acidimicrobiales bacterium]|nr:HAD-IIA family hydrolase [Acidimicrobiales bacterium]
MAPPCWLVDLDGVVWLGDQPIAGADRAVAALRARGARVAFFTNNSFPAHARHLDKLRRFGIEVPPEDLLSSAQAAAALVDAGERALVLGGAGVVEALEARKVEVHSAGTPDDSHHAFDAVVVGIDPGLDYRRLARAVTAVLGGARLIGTNEDATFPSPSGPLPGAGSVLAAVAYAAGVEPVVAGKPHDPAVALVVERLGAVETVVGDRPSTDGALARRLDARFALVLSGVTPAGHGALDPEPDLEAEDFAALVSRA